MAEKVSIPWFLRSGWRLLLALAGCLLIPLALLAFLVVSKSRETLLDEARAQDERAAMLAARVVDSRFAGLVEVTEGFAGRPSLASLMTQGEGAGIRESLTSLVQGSAWIDRVFITDPDGVEWYDFPHDPEVIGQDFSHRDWYVGVRGAGDTYVSQVYRRAAAPRHHLVAIATPIRDGEGTILGYLVAQHTIRDVAEWLASLLPDRSGDIVIIDRTGGVAMANGGGDQPKEVAGPILEAAIAAQGVGSREGVDPMSGRASLVSFAPAEVVGGFVLVSRPLGDVLAPARALERWIYGVSAAIAAAAIALGFSWLNVVRRQHLALAELHEQKALLTGLLVHDLRNPLTAALSYTSIIKREASGEIATDAAEIETALTRMQRLVDDILDVVKLEEGTLAIERKRTDLARLLEEAVRSYEGPAELAGVELSFESAADVQADIDPSITLRIAENLLTNALKHTRSGGSVAVLLSRDDGEIRIAVSDTGEGISAQSMPKLFKKFGRVAEQEGSRTTDTGFGLLFCRMAAEAQGGRVWAESELGRGSTFIVALPERASEASMDA